MMPKLSSGTWGQVRKPKYWSATFMGQWARSYGRALKVKILLPSHSAADDSVHFYCQEDHHVSSLLSWVIRLYIWLYPATLWVFHPRTGSRRTSRRHYFRPASQKNRQCWQWPSTSLVSSPRQYAVSFINNEKYLNISRNTNQTGRTNHSVEVYSKNGPFLQRWSQFTGFVLRNSSDVSNRDYIPLGTRELTVFQDMLHDRGLNC